MKCTCFVTVISINTVLFLAVTEGAPAHLEAKLIPVGDPTMRVHWYCNGEPISLGMFVLILLPI